jgi:hypothetical protein
MIAAAAATNDRRATLIAMRDKLAADMDAAPPAVVAQIAGRLAAILAEIEALPNTGTMSEYDELERQRATRRAKTAGVPRPGRAASQ